MTGILKSLAIAAAAFVLANFLLSFSLPEPPNHHRQKKYAKLMKKLQPEIVLLGNSMLGEAVDNDSFAELIGKRSAKFDASGSASAIWYLMLKNVVLKAKKKPSHVVVFFRDYFLTMPEYRVRGRYEELIRDLSSPIEPLIDKLSYSQNYVETFLWHTTPSYRNRAWLKERSEAFVKDTLVSKTLGQKADFAAKAVATVFRVGNLDTEILTAGQLAAETVEEHVFADDLQGSYLPTMVSLAAQSKVQLIFVRVKRRRDARHEVQSEALKQYIVDLSGYLKSNKIPLIDFTSEPRIHIKHFGGGDHLSRKQGRPLFTKLLAKRMARLLNEKPKDR